MVLNSSPAQSLSLYYCYAHEDLALLDELDKHLAQGTQSIRSNRDISEGDDWRAGMDERLGAADVLLLLVTEHLVDSGYCDSAEMQEALKRHEVGELVILPVILRPVDWSKTALAEVPTFPRDGQPLLKKDDADEAFAQVTAEVETLAEQLWGSSPTMVALPIAAIKARAALANEPDHADLPEASTTVADEPAHAAEPDHADLPEASTAIAAEPDHADLPEASTTVADEPDHADEPLTNSPEEPATIADDESEHADVTDRADTSPISPPDLSDVATISLPGSGRLKEVFSRLADLSDTTTRPLPDPSGIVSTPLPERAERSQADPSDIADVVTTTFAKPVSADRPGLSAMADIATTPFPEPPTTDKPLSPDASTLETGPLPTQSQVAVRNPYKGLRAFTAADAGAFFGRMGLINELALLIESMPAREKKGDPSSRLLAVIGPAGAGKSSAVEAGLVPSLRDGGVFDSADWVYLDPMVPGAHPLETLARTLAAHLPGKDLQTIRADLQDVAGLHLSGTRLIEQAGAESTHAVLVIDQFEELFTLTTDEVERRRFVNLLVNACTRQGGPMIVIVILRADFVSRLGEYPGLAALARLHRASPLAPTQDELRTIITQPLLGLDERFEQGLVQTLLSDARGLSNVLPHLQFTLHELFQERTGNQLTLEVYRELGSVGTALGQRAERTYRTLPSHEHRLATYALFLNLVDLGTAEQGPTLLQVKQSELKVGDEAQTRQIHESLDTFVEMGILRLQDIPDEADKIVELSHEIIMQAWPRLAKWLRIAREDKLFEQAFTRDVAQWELHDQSKAQLYRGAQLKKARAWAARHEPNAQEAAFLRASTAKRSRMFINIAVIALLLVALLGAVEGYYISHQPSPLLVTNINNSGTGSLRWSIDHAPSGGTITFDPHVRGTLTFTGGNLVVGANKDLTINGPGAGKLTLRSGDARSGFVVPDGSTLVISGLSLQGSKGARQGILANNGVLTLNNSVVSGNTTSGAGGGITSTDGILTLNNSVVSGNTTSGNGGGIYLFNGSLTLNNSSIIKNTSATGQGGGLYLLNSILTMRNSTIANNTSTAGGGIYSSNNTLTLIDDTISENTARDNGGGIFTNNSTITLDKSTVFDNTATNNGGGIFVRTANSPAAIRAYPTVLERSIVAENHSNANLDVAGTVVTKGYNLFEYFAGATFVDPQKLHTTDKEVNEVNALLIDGVLDKNGGTTLTHALLAGSPAINAIPVSACDLKTATTDQRGVKRPQGGACDIGAYEYQAHP